jgi:hypothetical protein
MGGGLKRVLDEKKGNLQENEKVENKGISRSVKDKIYKKPLGTQVLFASVA